MPKIIRLESYLYLRDSSRESDFISSSFSGTKENVAQMVRTIELEWELVSIGFDYDLPEEGWNTCHLVCLPKKPITTKLPLAL
jgi:hypothetical protein